MNIFTQVPAFWTQEQRQAMLDAAKLAGLNVLSLLNENTAVALHYGLDKQITEEPFSAIFYDLGASTLVVSLATYHSVVDSKKNKTIRTVYALIASHMYTQLNCK